MNTFFNFEWKYGANKTLLQSSTRFLTDNNDDGDDDDDDDDDESNVASLILDAGPYRPSDCKVVSITG